MSQYGLIEPPIRQSYEPFVINVSIPNVIAKSATYLNKLRERGIPWLMVAY